MVMHKDWERGGLSSRHVNRCWWWLVGVSTEQTPHVQRHLSAWSAAASCCLHAAPSSRGALPETHVQPVHSPLVPNTCTLLADTSRTSEDNRSPFHVSGTPKPLPVLLEAFNFKRKRIAATVFKSLILYSYFVHY